MSDQEIIASIGEQIEKLTRQSVEARTFSYLSEPLDVYYLQLPSGRVQRRVAAVKPLTILFEGTKDIVAWAASADVEADKEIYFNEDRIVACRWQYVPSREPEEIEAIRREHAVMPLPLQTGFRILGALENYMERGLPPREMWQFLRVNFHDALPRDAINLFQNLKLSKNDEGEFVTGVTGQSLRKSTSENISGTGAIPDELNFKVGVFEVPEVMKLRYNVTCALKFNHETGLFTIAALAGELKRAKWKALDDIVNPLKDDAEGREPVIAVFRGACAE